MYNIHVSYNIICVLYDILEHPFYFAPNFTCWELGENPEGRFASDSRDIIGADSKKLK